MKSNYWRMVEAKFNCCLYGPLFSKEKLYYLTHRPGKYQGCGSTDLVFISYVEPVLDPWIRIQQIRICNTHRSSNFFTIYNPILVLVSVLVPALISCGSETRCFS